MRITALFVLLLFYTSCADDLPLTFPAQNGLLAASDTSGGYSHDAMPEGVRITQNGHRMREFRRRETVAFDLKLRWPGQRQLEASIVQRTDGSGIYLRYSTGTQVWWDGREVWWLPADGDAVSPEMARFDLFAWHYFFCLPYKLMDPGTEWQQLPDRTLDGRPNSAGRIRFSPGTGDTPDDWFVLFTDKGSGLMQKAIYITTFGSASAHQAAKTPQTIDFDQFRMQNGIPFARHWRFGRWQTDSLNGEEYLGEAVVSNIAFDVEAGQLRVHREASRI